MLKKGKTTNQSSERKLCERLLILDVIILLNFTNEGGCNYMDEICGFGRELSFLTDIRPLITDHFSPSLKRDFLSTN